MKKKRILVAAMASCMALTATFTGCSLVSSNNKADMAQVIATVDISKSDKFTESGLADYSSAVSSTSIIKRDLVSYFLNVGYSYVQSYGYTYADTFNLLIDALINNAVLTQYATMALLKDNTTNTSSELYDPNALSTYKSKEDEVARYEYLLGGEDSEQVLLAKYSLYKSLNSAIDNYEQNLIDEEDGYVGTETRTTPTNLETEQDDYYPQTEDGKLDYYVYTGYTDYRLNDSGAYQDDAIEGTTRATRIKAYNTFINTLRTNGLIDESEKESLSDILSLNYIQKEYVAQLETRIINKYYEVYEDEQTQKLLADDYSYIQNVYEELLNSQTNSYKTASAFESALSSMSSSSFLLYSPDTSDSDLFDGENYGKYGFVYNILLPFSAAQSAVLSELTSMKAEDENENDYYYMRNQLLKLVKTEDQRTAWFNGATDYSFKVDGSAFTENYFGQDKGREYLFFEGNLTESAEGGRYKKLLAYDGRYSYNGNVYENEDGSYTLIGNKLDIDGMLKEFAAYIDFVLGGTGNVTFDNGYNPETGNAAYYLNPDFKNGEDEIDYSLFMYASGKINFAKTNRDREDLFNADTAQYKAMSAVNELQFAYTTDTSVLSQYIGYSVSAYDTSYIKEFEYAAKYAINEGAGSFAVCAGDYGWHIIYVTFTFDKDSTYNPVWENIDVEGTFENYFFEWIKSVDLADISSVRRTKIISDFNKESTVTKYQSRYKDLLDLDNN